MFIICYVKQLNEHIVRYDTFHLKTTLLCFGEKPLGLLLTSRQHTVVLSNNVWANIRQTQIHKLLSTAAVRCRVRVKTVIIIMYKNRYFAMHCVAHSDKMFYRKGYLSYFQFTREFLVSRHAQTPNNLR